MRLLFLSNECGFAMSFFPFGKNDITFPKCGKSDVTFPIFPTMTFAMFVAHDKCATDKVTDTFPKPGDHLFLQTVAGGYNVTLDVVVMCRRKVIQLMGFILD
jgi:hypothetical protein